MKDNKISALEKQVGKTKQLTIIPSPPRPLTLDGPKTEYKQKIGVK